MAKPVTKAELEERKWRAFTEWMAATDPYVSDLARRRYRRAVASLKRNGWEN